MKSPAASLPIALILFAQFIAVSIHSSGAEQASKNPVPTKDELVETRKQVDQIYGNDIANAKTSAERMKLANEILSLASQTNDDPIARYVLLIHVRDLATKSVDASAAQEAIEIASKAIDLIDQNYQCKPVQMKASMLWQMSRLTRTSTPRRAVASAASELVDDAIGREQFDLANQILKFAQSIAEKARDSSVLKEIATKSNEVQVLGKYFQDAKAALEQLKANENDPTANVAAGKYECYVRGNWKVGLPMLARGSEAKLSEVADREMKSTQAGQQSSDVADGWWEIAEEQPDVIRNRIRAHAAELYRISLPNLTGITKIKVEKRLGEYDQGNQKQIAAVTRNLPKPKEADDAASRKPKRRKISDKTLFNCVLGIYKHRSNTAVYPFANLSVPRKTLFTKELQDSLRGKMPFDRLAYQGSARFYAATDGIYELRAGNCSATIDGNKIDGLRGNYTAQLPLRKGVHSILIETTRYGQAYIDVAEIAIVVKETGADVPLFNSWGDIQRFMSTPVASQRIVEVTGWKPEEKYEVKIDVR